MRLNGRYPRYGWRIAPDGDGRDLEPDPSEQKIIAEILRLHRAGDSDTIKAVIKRSAD